MSGEVSQSITRQSASNLALAFILLPSDRRASMAALYAFCREVDDVADELSRPLAERQASLDRWRDEIRTACHGGSPTFPVCQELLPAIRTHHLPFQLFDELLQGVEADLHVQRYPTYQDLEQYCYRVASVVGLLSIRIFGYSHPASQDYAIYLGKALQLTNILRDVRNDAERGRIYLPQEELARHGAREDDLLQFRYTEPFAAAAAAVARRARHFYQLARQTLPPEDRSAMATAELMGSVYWQLLRKLETRRFHTLGPRPVRVGKLQKLALIARAWIRLRTGSFVPTYGTP